MSEEYIETFVKTVEITTMKKPVAGDMEDFWDDCLDSKQINQSNKKQNPSNKKINLDDDDLPDDYITCKYIFR